MIMIQQKVRDKKTAYYVGFTITVKARETTAFDGLMESVRMLKVIFHTSQICGTDCDTDVDILIFLLNLENVLCVCLRV